MLYLFLGTTLAVVWTAALASLPWIQDREMKRKAASAPAPKPAVAHAH
jgi:hypothetical protein